MTALRDYSARVGQPELTAGPPRYDEVVTPDGTLRPGWKSLADVAVGLTEGDLRRVDADIHRLLADDGVTYARPGGRGSEPWRLDPFPLVVEADEWARLEVGLAQRAELLNAVLVDLYGEQRLLSSGVLPPAAVFAHPGYVRVVARASAHDAQPLTLTGTDLGRGADGQWLVLGDRAQAPSGIGYAMENRRVISRVLPELYQEARLHRMGPFFAALRTALLQSAPGDESHARVVVLSPGSSSETAYDQAFVASALGFPLVEGTDLVMRDGRVWMRVLGRREPVDVILRRVDSAWSDPLELRGESQLGVAGLSEAVRRGTVRVVNGLGAGVLENPALMPFLPAICRALLDEDLALPSVPTWWGGDPEGLDQLLARAGSLVVRAVDRPEEVVAPPAELRAMVEREPHRYVGQQRVALSQAPLLGQRDIRPASLTLRAFTLRHGQAYRPMIGGLARVVDRGGLSTSSKDVWVLKRGADDADQGLPEVFPTSGLRAPEASLPWVLEDMFWLGRYAERAEALLRLVLVAHALSEEFHSLPGSPGGRALTVVMDVVGQLAGAPYPREETDTDLRSILLDPRRTGSVAQSVATLRDAAQSVRDQLSPDIWRSFGVHDRAVGLLVESPHTRQITESAGRMLTAMLSVNGVVDNMMRDPGWHLIGAGRAVERGLQLCRLLAVTTTERRGIDVDRRVLDAVLTASESAVTHTRRYRGNVRPGNVLELLLLDNANPRSLRFTLQRVAEHLGALPGSTGSSRPERLLSGLIATLDGSEMTTLVAIGGVDRPNLVSFLEHVTGQLSRLGEAIAELHFSTGPAPRPMSLLLRAEP
ncbi:MAG: hypothetical protein JWO46_1955 [Nocardioidaceae bacterium]|nr:hypothetical protein [Nocardioidaceae bacterium]